MPDPLRFDATEPLPLTGERTAPDIPDENYWFQRHVVAYRFVQKLVAGTRVLDAGAGEGYGSSILGTAASSIVACDLEEPVLVRAKHRYGTPGLLANLVRLPVADRMIESVVSMQTIEHLHSPVDFVAECSRILRPGGLLVISTPNRLTFSPDGQIRNPFHTFEFSPDDLRSLVAESFDDVAMWGIFHGARIRTWEVLHRESLPERLIAQPAPAWPKGLRKLVHGVKEDDFQLRTTALDRSLDLLLVARAR